MTTETHKRHYLSQVEEKAAVRKDTLEDGRYVPHSGGLMGWFENSGVLKYEQANNYRFHTALSAEAVRSKLFERWSDGENINRRASGRHELNREVNATLAWTGGTFRAVLKDYSRHGFKMQIIEEVFGLNKGDETRMRIYSGPDREHIEFEINSRVMWISSSGREQTVWSVGLMFLDFSEHDADRLHAFLG